MTKEEQIKQKAEQYMRDFHNTELSETDLILFAEQLISETTKELQEKLKHRNCVDCSNHSSNLKMRNLELEKQIEKMKCCENCKYKDCNKTSQYQKCWYCKNKNKWELAE